MPRPPAADPRATIRALLMIRISFVLGVALFGGVTWWMVATGRRHPSPAPRGIEYATLGVWAVATIAVMLLRRRYAAAADAQARARMAVLGWAAGEMAGLAGAVHYFVSGNPQRFAFGMLVFVIALLMFPVPRR